MKSNSNIKNRLSASENNCTLSVYKTLVLTAILLFSLINSQVVAQNESDQSLEPELEMDIIRYLNGDEFLSRKQYFNHGCALMIINFPVEVSLWDAETARFLVFKNIN